MFQSGDNSVCIEGDINPDVRIDGKGNIVSIDCMPGSRGLRIMISGNNNRIHIGKSVLAELSITIGSHRPVSGVNLAIADNFSIEPGGKFDIFTDLSTVTIGKACMFSRGVTVRLGDNPHLLFTKSTGEYRDGHGHIHIGDHVWIGEGVFLTKRAQIASECIVAARAVVASRFLEENTLIGGNPARALRADIQWVRNRGHLEPESIYALSMKEYDQRIAEELARRFPEVE